MNKEKLMKYLKRIGIGLGVCVVGGVVSFYVVVLSGLFPRVQELWVTTAMTTLNHKWLATSFIPEAKINEIMERVKVNDSGYVTDTSLVGQGKPKIELYKPTIESRLKAFYELTGREMISKPTVEEALLSMKESYKEQGYEELEEGIWFKNASGTGWKGYLLMVEDPSRVSLAQTRYQFERGDLIKTLVPLHNARVGINAGGFVDGPNYDSNGGQPAGLLVVDGEIIQSNGDTEHSVIGFNEDNVLVLGKLTKQEVIDAKIRDAVDFKPFLIVNGEPMMSGDQQGGWGIAPRTAIGQRPTGEVIFLCVDGRQAHSIGCDLRPLQDTLLEEGCINAAMVDGGSSTVMYHADKGYLNKPSLGHERYINNCWLVK